MTFQLRRQIANEHRQRRSRLPSGFVAGFTAIELMMVLCIAGMVTAIAVPNVDQAMKTYRADFAARQVLNDMQATRMLALSRNVRYRLVLTPNGTTYVRQMRDPVTLCVRDRRDLYAAGGGDLCGKRDRSGI